MSEANRGIVDALQIKKQLVEALAAELSRMAVDASRSAEEATDEMFIGSERTRNRGERGKFLESAYLLSARARQAEEFQALIGRLRAMDLSPSRKIREGSLATVQENGHETTQCLFLAFGGMGRTLNVGDRTFLMVSPESPMGKAFVGKRVSSQVGVALPTGPKTYFVLLIE